MRIYLDDDSASGVLARLLTQAGHEVLVPHVAGTAGAADPVHLIFAVKDQRVLLSQNYDDFEDLHDLVIASGGHHPGILVVRRDNDPRRDLSMAGIVRAIRRLESAGVEIVDHFYILNRWR